MICREATNVKMIGGMASNIPLAMMTPQMAYAAMQPRINVSAVEIVAICNEFINARPKLGSQ